MKINEEFRVNPRYDLDFKHRVIKEIIMGRYTKKEAMELYNISWPSIQRWLNKHGQSVILEQGIKNITLKKFNNPSWKNKLPESEKTEHLRKRIKELEQQLKSAELKADLYDTMIDIAEAQFKIPIRKKYVTRQSPKTRKGK